MDVENTVASKSAGDLAAVSTKVCNLGNSAGNAATALDTLSAAGALRLLITRARCLLWHADVTAVTGEFDWDLQMADEDASEQFLPIKRLPGQSYSDAWYDSRLPEDNLRNDSTSSKALLTGKTEYSQRFRCRCLDGSIRWLHEDVRIEAIAPGRWRCVGVCTDMTQIVAAEENRSLLASIV